MSFETGICFREHFKKYQMSREVVRHTGRRIVGKKIRHVTKKLMWTEKKRVESYEVKSSLGLQEKCKEPVRS